jgi:hypothetical protein
MNTITLLASMILALLLSGCVTLPTGPSVTMAPASGKPFNVFQSEFEACNRSAEQRLGAYYDYSSSQEAQYHYDTVFMQCMLSHGNTVLSPVMRWYRISPPAAAQDGYDPPPSGD